MQALTKDIIPAKQSRWLAVQFLSKNEVTEEFLTTSPMFEQLKDIRSDLEIALAGKLENHFHQVRVNYIHDICLTSVEYTRNSDIPLSDKLDKIFTHKFFGIPIFLGIMWLIFQITFTWVGAPLSDLLDGFIGGSLTDWVTSFLTTIGASGFITDLVADGIIAGVGGVLVFVPQILVIFFFISVLEDSGYMARIAVVMDRVMEIFGLNGKAFIPMIIGFGCNVPGIMAARSIEESKERTLTILVSPFMSCSARLPYTLFSLGYFLKNIKRLSFYHYT